MNFRKYDHLERMGHPEVRDLDIGLIHVFPKLDGTNASVWNNNGHICAGSRNRELSANADNAGFCAWVHSDEPGAVAVRTYLFLHPERIVYGEWLVPHSLKTYREDAWRRLWIFDVYDGTRGGYLAYEAYRGELEDLGADVIQPLCTAENPSASQLQEMSDRNTYLVTDGEGCGEGIVLKNYAWRNQFGRQPWAKMVRAEFKEKNSRAFGAAHVKGERDICGEIVTELATEAWIRKEFLRVVALVAADLGEPLETGGQPSEEFIAANRGKIIPRTLGTLFYVFVGEEIHTILKKWKNPTLDFGRLNKLLTIRIKTVLTEVF